MLLWLLEDFLFNSQVSLYAIQSFLTAYYRPKLIILRSLPFSYHILLFFQDRAGFHLF